MRPASRSRRAGIRGRGHSVPAIARKPAPGLAPGMRSGAPTRTAPRSVVCARWNSRHGRRWRREESVMQAYWGNPENKAAVMVRITEDGMGFPLVWTPESSPESQALDYEERLGIPLPLALVGECIWLGASRRYAQRWPARFFDTIQPNQNLSAVVWQVMSIVLQTIRDGGRDWPWLGEHVLAVLARAPRS